MRSYGGQRQQKTPQGALNRKEAVKPQGSGTQGPSSSLAQTRTPSSGTEISLLEKMLERGNMLEALR